MAELLTGALGAFLVLLVFAGGVLVGRKLQTPTAPPETGEKKEYIPTAEEIAERKRLQEDQAAFQVLMKYSADMAYGRVSANDILGGDGQ